MCFFWLLFIQLLGVSIWPYFSGMPHTFIFLPGNCRFGCAVAARHAWTDRGTVSVFVEDVAISSLYVATKAGKPASKRQSFPEQKSVNQLLPFWEAHLCGDQSARFCRSHLLVLPLRSVAGLGKSPKAYVRLHTKRRLPIPPSALRGRAGGCH